MANDVVSADLLKLLADLPPVVTPKDLATVLQTTPDALAQDRYRGRGIPYIRVGGPESRRIRYLRDDVIRHLTANRSTFG